MKKTLFSTIIGVLLLSFGCIKLGFFGDWLGLLQVFLGTVIIILDGLTRIRINRIEEQGY